MAPLIWMVLSLLLCTAPQSVDAWVENYPGLPQPEGGLVLVGPFCQVADCTHQGAWKTAMQQAAAQWNAAGANFQFTEAPLSSLRDPCRIYTEDGEEGVAVIFSTYETVCPSHRDVFDSPAVTVVGWPGRSYYVHINLDHIQANDLPRITRFLLHELGHTVGLGHPDEAGQRVEAVMNSRVVYDTLQPDDIAGIRALYGERPVEPRGLVGHLENPRDGSAQSGIGVISGWVCEADEVEISIWPRRGGQVHVMTAPYGTERADTEAECDDTDNGFGLLFNWNLLGNGENVVDLLVDGEHLDRADVTITKLDGEYPTDLSGRYTLENFPYPGESVVIEWEESLQNFVIVETQ